MSRRPSPRNSWRREAARQYGRDLRTRRKPSRMRASIKGTCTWVLRTRKTPTDVSSRTSFVTSRRTFVHTGSSSRTPSPLLGAPVLSLTEFEDSETNLVADGSHFFERLPFGVFEWPVVAFRARDQGAGVTAAHRDEELRLHRDIAREQPRLRLRHVDVDLSHRF